MRSSDINCRGSAGYSMVSRLKQLSGALRLLAALTGIFLGGLWADDLSKRPLEIFRVLRRSDRAGGLDEPLALGFLVGFGFARWHTTSQETAMDYAYLARERALVMAQADWHAGRIGQDQVIAQAHQYEAYLANRSGRDSNATSATIVALTTRLRPSEEA